MKQKGDSTEFLQADRELEEVMKAAGPRVDPPPEDLTAIREAARAEWRRVTMSAPTGESSPELARLPDLAARTTRSGMRWLPLAATLAVALLAGWWIYSRPTVPVGPSDRFATVERLQGSVRVGERLLSAGSVLEPGASIETVADSGVALLLAGRSVRIAERSSVRLTSENRLELMRGAVYVDSPPGAPSPGLEVVTAHGWIQEIGTQFEVRLGQSGEDLLAVRVREGRVRIESPETDCSHGEKGRCEASASEALIIDSGGLLRFESVPVYGEAWSAYVALAPLPGTDNALDVVTWAARETGLKIEWSGDEVQGFAESQRYSGIEQAPALVLENALRSIGLSFERTNGSLVVTR